MVQVAVTANILLLSGALEFSPSLLAGASDAALVYVDKPVRSASPKRSKLGFNLSYEMASSVLSLSYFKSATLLQSTTACGPKLISPDHVLITEMWFQLIGHSCQAELG